MFRGLQEPSMSTRPVSSLRVAALALLLSTGAAIAADKDADQPPVAKGPTDMAAQAGEGERIQQKSSTFNEVTADVQAKFDALDLDHDGSSENSEASVSNILGSQFAALDSNGDGKLSMTEFAAASDLASIKTMNGDRDRK